MRLSLRFMLPLALVLAGLAYAVIPLVDTLTLKWFVRYLEIRSQLIVGTMEEPLTDLITSGSKAKLQAYFQRIIKDERLFAIGFCNLDNQLAYKTQTYPDSIPCEGTTAVTAGQTAFVRLVQGAVHVSSVGIEALMHGMLGFLLFAGALHVKLQVDRARGLLRVLLGKEIVLHPPADGAGRYLTAEVSGDYAGLLRLTMNKNKFGGGQGN